MCNSFKGESITNELLKQLKTPFISDTAYNYNTEESIGKALKTWLDSGKVKREELFITTKVVSAQSKS